MRNIYEKAIQEMKPEEIDHWQTDLYLKVTPVSKKLVDEYEFKNIVEIFTSDYPDDKGTPWYDIPFAYIPEWDKKLNNKGE